MEGLAMRLKDKVAIITGSTKGIGKTAALMFAKEGASVIINGRSEKEGDEVSRLIKKDGGDAQYIKADVTNKHDVKKLVESALEKYGKIDILYNNAGHFYLEPAPHLLKEEEWERIMDVNLKSVYLCSKYVVPVMIKNEGGSIINTSSVQGKVGYKDLIGYNTSKAGVINLTRSLALSYAPMKIRVNCICPGPIYNEAYKRSTISKDPELEFKQWMGVIPLGRLGKREDVAKLAIFLASDDSSYITGEFITIDGGLTAKAWTPWDTEKTEMIKYSG
jgi:NAD(P)-dependent dehydrogenase (short-subunit alcohol dehydrogenase family)